MNPLITMYFNKLGVSCQAAVRESVANEIPCRSVADCPDIRATSAQIPTTMSYQSVLTTGRAALVVNGTHSLVFKQYECFHGWLGVVDADTAYGADDKWCSVCGAGPRNPDQHQL